MLYALVTTWGLSLIAVSVVLGLLMLVQATTAALRQLVAAPPRPRTAHPPLSRTAP